MIEFLQTRVWAHLPKRVKPRDRYLAALLWSGGLVALAWVLLGRERVGPPGFFGLHFAALCLGLALCVSGAGDKVYLAALKFFAIFGYFIGRIVLTVVFYLGVTPLALLMRLSGRKFLDPGFGKAPAPTWHQHKPSADPAQFYRQF